MLIGESTPLFNRVISHYFFFVGLCPTRLTFCRWRGRAASVGSKLKPLIAWTRVHSILHQRTCCKKRISEVWSNDLPHATWHLEKLPIGINRRLWVDRDRTADLHREMIAIGRLAVDSHHDRGARDRWIAIVHPTGASSDGSEASWKNSTIAIRSNRDHGAIEPRSGSLRDGIASSRSEDDRRLTRTTIVARSWVFLKWKLRLICHEIEATIVINGSSRLHNRSWPSILLHDRIKRPKNRANFPLWKHVFPPSFLLTFDRFVKELSEFRGRSLVHRDPPAFRLDCKAIGAGLIANFSLISSNFPLEFRTSARKNPSKFTSIQENWSPILAEIGLVVRLDQL